MRRRAAQPAGVVADEVRNLANKSDEAAKATKDLIESSIAAVAEGSNVVNEVTQSLDKYSRLYFRRNAATRLLRRLA